MEHPVYPFRAVLRELRHDAGLTILAAAGATGYGKYERWESGQTKVGGQYLRSLAEAFAVTEDLHLLLYAWVLDQLTPDAGGPPCRMDVDELRRHVRLAPETVIDLHEHKALVREPGRHVDIALLCLAARYTDRHVIVLPASERCDLPPRAPGVPILGHLYGDVVHDGTAAIGRALLVRGIDTKPYAIDVSNIAPAMTDPNTYLALADDLDTVEPAADQPVAAFAAGTAPDARRFAELLTSLRNQNRELLEAAGKTPTDEDVERLTENVMAGKTRSMLWLLARAAARRRFPTADPAVTAELRAMHDRLRDGWRDAVQQQTVVELRRADTSQVFEALDALRSRRTA